MRLGLWSRNRQRLIREFQAFETEWTAAVARADAVSAAWNAPGKEHMDRVRAFIDSGGDRQAAWLNLSAARRLAVYACTPAELAGRVAMLRAESEKLASWRADLIRSMLKETPVSASTLISAMQIRDEFYQNQYHRIALAADQFKVLLIVAAAALAGFALIWLKPVQEEADLLDPRLLGSVLLMGVLGGSFSSARSLFAGDVQKRKIPDHMMQWWVTLVRTLFGGAAGLAGYLFYESGILQIMAGSNAMATDLAIAFVFGYASERLVSKIADRAS